MNESVETHIESKSTTNNTRLYTLLVIIISYAFQIIIYFNGRGESPLIAVMMFIPGIIAAILLRRTGEGFKKIGWGPGNWIYLIAAVYVPLISTGILILIFQRLGWATLTIFTLEDGIITSTLPLILGNQPQNLPFFALNLALSFLQISLIGAFFALGEEFGWRGYLQGRMIAEHGLIKGLVLMGLIWGYWHLPIILMGFTFPNVPVLGGFVLFPISTVFMTVYFYWIYQRSRSIWAPVLGHGAFNIAGGLIFSGMELHKNILVFQLIWIAMFGVLAIPCYMSLKNQGTH